MVPYRTYIPLSLQSCPFCLNSDIVSECIFPSVQSPNLQSFFPIPRGSRAFGLPSTCAHSTLSKHRLLHNLCEVVRPRDEYGWASLTLISQCEGVSFFWTLSSFLDTSLTAVLRKGLSYLHFSKRTLCLQKKGFPTLRSDWLIWRQSCALRQVFYRWY